METYKNRITQESEALFVRDFLFPILGPQRMKYVVPQYPFLDSSGRSRFTNPLMEVGQDVALISSCMCRLNAVDIFNAKKDQYVNGIFHYERLKTRMSRSDKGYFEIRVPKFLKPTFEKYLSRKVGSPWLFNFHDQLSTSDSFRA